MKLSLEEKFNKYYILEPNTGCWIWTGSVNTDRERKILRFYHGRKSVNARRFAFQLYVGEIIDDLITKSTCNNDYCINPEHLDLISPKEHINITREAVKLTRGRKRERKKHSEQHTA